MPVRGFVPIADLWHVSIRQNLGPTMMRVNDGNATVLVSDREHPSAPANQPEMTVAAEIPA